MNTFASAQADLIAARATRKVDATLAGFAPFTDPRRTIGELTVDAPLALFPVRIETRFADVGTPDAPHPQLWVRIYPDDCSIDTFEATLSDAEVANAKIYWQRIWAAGGVEAGQRGAWAGLVSAHGSGRSGYIVDTYRPTNLATAPVKGAPTDEILVVGTSTPLVTADANAISAYWAATWRAAGDATRQGAATTALVTAVGSARAAELVANYAPFNLADAPTPPATTSSVAVSVSFVIFDADPPSKPWSWSQAAVVTDFPERFVVLGYQGETKVLDAIGGVVTTPLYVGPDPSAPPANSIHPDGQGLSVPPQLKWLVDFDEAQAAGMALAIDLTAEQARDGFDRLIVVGVQLGVADGSSALAELLQHHQAGRAGLALVPQGAPTHNSSGQSAGYTQVDDPDQSFDDRGAAPLFTTVADPMVKRDGQWVAEALGVDPGVLVGVHAAGGTDQVEARAMQRALWPATIGYWMNSMMHPLFSDRTVAAARQYFTRYVSGRGSIPSIRVGHQPYGILPTTAFSRIGWLSTDRRELRDSGDIQFMAELFTLLTATSDDVKAMSAPAAHVGQAGDAQQILLDILGLEPASVEHYWRYAETWTEISNLVKLGGKGLQADAAFRAAMLHAKAQELVTRLSGEIVTPEILKQVFFADAGLIDNVVDDRPLSETSPIRAYTADGRNYIRWLIDAASTSLAAVAAEEGFTGDSTPTALLYLMLRHALQVGYYDAGYNLHDSAGFLTSDQLAAMKPDPVFIHVDPEAPVSESRYAALFTTESRITGNPTQLVADFITAHLDRPESAGLADQLAAMAILAELPTSALERAFAEHVDVSSYRFDAWQLGLVAYQLERMRAEQPAAGIHLGAYAWVEDLRPARAHREEAQIPADVAVQFADLAPLMTDPSNGGYIHAPSLPHGRTAAVLRSGYLANATADSPDALAVNLSSDRVRAALGILEGVRNGQGIGALLGYQFERGLHDDYDLAEVDQFIYPLRKAFPLAADSLASTATGPGVPIEAIDANNVVDGRKLVERIRSSKVTTYPFGLTDLPGASAAAEQAINAEAQAIIDVYDAIADLALAEGVHQAVQGNFERVGATLDAYSNASFPPEPEVVQTPNVGVGLTHRVAVHLQPGLVAAASSTPRAVAEPAVDAWLESLLPSFAEVGVVVVWTDPVDGSAHSRDVLLSDLDVNARDLIELVKPDDVQAMSELDDRILRFVLDAATPRADAVLQIKYQTGPAGKLSIFEVSALIRQLRTLVNRSRPLTATDSMPSGQANTKQNAAVAADRARVSGPMGVLATLGAEITAYTATLAALLADPVAHRAAIVAGIDGFADDAVALLERAARFAVPEAGWGFAYRWKQSTLAELLGQVSALMTRWDTRLADFDAQLTAYDLLPAATASEVRFAQLQAAESLVTTTLEQLPAAPATLRIDILGMRTAMGNRRDQLAATLTTAFGTVADAVAAVQALLPITGFDPQPFDIDALGDSAIVFAQDLLRSLTGVSSTITGRLSTTQRQLDTFDASSSPLAQVDAFTAAAKALLGDSFVIIPEFTLSPDQGAQWESSLAAEASLLDYLTTTIQVQRPVADWLSGAARVRPVLHGLELAGTFAEAFGKTAPALSAAQFPYAAGDSWAAMEFPEDKRPTSDRLLYTAHYVTPFDPTSPQCGLLLDEWTEVIPSVTQETGITFNFDRPDNEPPQAILIVTPATGDGVWHWEDVVGALNETLDLAKRRALEPGQIDDTAYATFLPATDMAVSLWGISIGTPLAAASRVMSTEELKSRG